VLPEEWDRSTVVEFAADYYSARQTKCPRRWYGVVLAQTEDAVAIIEFESAGQALRAAPVVAEPVRLVKVGYLNIVSAKMRIYDDNNITGPRRALLDALVNEIKEKCPEEYAEWWCTQK
jgi:hypothetical protein